MREGEIERQRRPGDTGPRDEAGFSPSLYLSVSPSRLLSVRRNRFAAGLSVAAWATALPLTPTLGQTTRPAHELTLSGGDRICWMVVGQSNAEEQKLAQSFAYWEAGAAKPRAASGVPPQLGEIVRAAVVADDLYVFYQTGRHVRYTRRGSRPELQLSSNEVPLALAGEPSSPRASLWAVVHAKTADRVEADWLKVVEVRRLEDAGVDERADRAADATATRPVQERREGTLHLIFYDGAFWQPAQAAPDEAGDGARVWVAFLKDRAQMFWQRGVNDLEVHHAWYTDRQWIIGPPIPLARPPRAASAGVMNGQLVFMTVVDSQSELHRAEYEAWGWREARGGDDVGQWSRLPPLNDTAGDPLRIPSDSVISPFGDQLAVMKLEAGGAGVGLWPSGGGAPAEPFQPVPQSTTWSRRSRYTGLRDLAALLVVATVLSLVYWRRQESISQPVPLPTGWAIVGPGKRALAAVVDMAPALAVVAYVWYEPISQYAAATYEAAQTGAQEDAPVWPLTLTWASLAFRLSYTGYCLLCELLIATTIGKRLLGCSVMSESLERPNRVQIVIRNVARMVEFEPYLMIWPFMLVVFLTRNRQRVGDLLARTVVVERQHVLLDLPEDHAGPPE